jgi:hypothetical protein
MSGGGVGGSWIDDDVLRSGAAARQLGCRINVQGVIVNGAATTLDGVHCWNGGDVAISLGGSYDIQDRVIR